MIIDPVQNAVRHWIIGVLAGAAFLGLLAASNAQVDAPIRSPLSQQAWDELERLTDAILGQEKRSASVEQRNRAFAAAVRKQAASHASEESGRYLSGMCDPTYSLSPGLDRDTTCEMEKATFQMDYWLAMQGDYTAQQGLAWCFEIPQGTATRCAKVVQPNQSLSCAWQIVALSSGGAYVSSFDVTHYRNRCTKLPRWEMEEAQAAALALFSRIYHKPLPGVLPPVPAR
jgi:hypothetical protein